MTRNRDIANILGKTEASNTTNVALGTGSGNLEVYQTLDNLPSTSLTSGDQAFIESSGRLYISNGSGWYNVALINASPSLTLDQSGTILLNADTLTVTVTASATDSDDNQDMITFSVESDGNMLATGVTVSQDSSVFTITSLTEDSGGVAGDFTLTFKATDGIAVDNEDLSFSLAFSNVVDSSAETILLMKAAGNGANNAAITFLDSDGSAGVGYNENGDPQASTFTPYRSAGYSSYFGGGNVGFYAADNAEFTLGTSDFCMEGWLWITDYSPLQMFFSQWATGGGTNTFQCRVTTGGYLEFVLSNSTTLTATGTQVPTYQWVHYAFVRNGSNFNIYQDGVSLYSDTSFSHTFTDTSDPLYVGRWYGSTDYAVEGYMFDVRFVVGSAVYTGAFTPPTEKLENITNTKLLTCRLPYIVDESTTGHALTANGAVKTEAFAPYDYEPWVGDDHGGSVNFDGSDSLKVDGSPTWPNFGTGAFTVECWVHQPTLASKALVNVHRQAVASGWYLSLSSAGNPNWGSYGNGDNADNTSSGAILAGQWNHIAMVRTSTSTNGSAWYINGKAAGTFTDTSNYASYTYGPWIGSNDTSGGNQAYFVGNIADVRVSNSAVYSAAFTPPTAPLSATANTVHLMNNKSDANIYDASAANTFKVSGSVTNTSTRKFTTSSSVYFDGSNDVLTIPSSPQIILSSSDFTLEGWFYPEDITPPSGLGTIAAIHTSDNTGWYFSLYQSKWRFQGYSSLIFNSGSNATQDAWSHVAITRSGNNYTMWVNGTSSNTATSSLDWTGTADLTIGYSHSSYYQGYIQDFRLTKGLARYTSTFTPPTAEFEL
jgi:hypothetical protein